MSSTGPDAQRLIILDRDEHGAGWEKVTFAWHDGSVPLLDRWPGFVNQSQYEDLSTAAGTSQTDLNDEADIIFGNWYTSMGGGYKTAMRQLLEAAPDWPL